jgi:hypothetical protein
MRRLTLASLLGFIVLLTLAGATAAKGNALAELDAPIPPGAEPGRDIEVGWRAWMPDVKGDWPFSGSPVFIRLNSADGSGSTEELGIERPTGSGHYHATISVPAGGVGLVEVGLFGESCVNGACSRSDILFELPAAQRVPVPIAAGPLDPPLPQMPVIRPEARPVVPDENAPLAPAVVLAGGAAVVVLAIGMRRRVRGTHGPARVAAPAHAGLRRGS